MENIDHMQTVLFRMEVDREMIAASVLERNRFNSAIWALHPCCQMLGIHVVEHQVQRSVLTGNGLKLNELS